MVRATDAIAPVLVVGASGMLARAVAVRLTQAGLSFGTTHRAELDVTDEANILRAIDGRWRTVINCAAYTDVDGAESQPARAAAINGVGAGNLARRCAETETRFVHYSSDYVFDGSASQPYETDDSRAPLGAYGRSKALGEDMVRASGASLLLIRTGWLYAPWGRNFVLTVRQLLRTRERIQVVCDQIGRPTSALYLATRSLGLLERRENGVFHVTDGGSCSWFELACKIAELDGSRCLVEPCMTSDFPRPAPRPAYSVLSLTRVDAVLGPSRPWQTNLADALGTGPVDESF